MEGYLYEKLKVHIGHNIVCVAYGNIDNPVNVAIECEDCCEVLVDANAPFISESDNSIEEA